MIECIASPDQLHDIDREHVISCSFRADIEEIILEVQCRYCLITGILIGEVEEEVDW